MSILVGIGVGLTLTLLSLEAFGFAVGGAVALLQLFLVPGLGLGLLCWRRDRPRAKARRIGLALILAAVASLAVSGVVERRQLAASKATGDALCLALESCRKNSGRYPRLLQELVPTFLPAVPATCMGVFRSIPFDYRASPDGDDFTLGFHSTFFIYCERGRVSAWVCDD